MNKPKPLPPFEVEYVPAIDGNGRVSEVYVDVFKEVACYYAELWLRNGALAGGLEERCADTRAIDAAVDEVLRCIGRNDVEM